MKKFFALLLACTFLVAFAAGCGGGSTGEETGSPVDGETMTIRIAHTGAETTLMHKSFQVVESYIEENSNGALQVDIFPNGVLGTEADLLSATQAGDIQMMATNNGYLVTVNPLVEVFSVPFAFPSEEVAYAVLDGEFGQKMLDSMEEACGLVGLGYYESSDFRELTSNVEIRSAEDLQGLKIRVMPNALQVQLWECLGTSPSTLSFGELYTALQQGTVDAQENPVELMLSQRFYEVQDYLIKTDHIFSNGMMVGNPAWFNGLSPELQQVVLDGVQAGQNYWREEATTNREAYYQQAEENGMTVIELDDATKEQLAEMAQPVVDTIASNIGQDLVDELYAAVDAAVAQLG